MTKLLIIFLVVVSLCYCYGLPVLEKKEETENKESKIEPQEGDDWELNLEYGRYLKEVVQALESDTEFRKKLENANVDDIKSGKISRELHLVDHQVRSKLDELKRRELERLRHIAVKEHEKKVGVDRGKLKIPVHVDHRNPERFEAEDLRKLIVQLNHDLELVDEKRQKEFKNYELEKEYEYKHKLEGLDEDHKLQAIKEHDDQLSKHKEHPKLHHPGSKQQFEEVWEEQDHMNSEDFDPRTFFHLHDLDGNGYWDENEVKALFQKELDKMYDPNAPEDDLTERYEEMERMRSHVFGETDTDRNNLISYEEFLEQTKKSEFERDEGWQGLDEQELYSQQEYEEYERQRQMEIKQLVESGAMPPPPGYYGGNVPQRLVMEDPSHARAGNAPNIAPQGYQQLPNAHQGYQSAPQGYQAVPQGYQNVPQGYQNVPQGYQNVPQGYQNVPQGYQNVPQGYQNVPQGYQNVPQGYQAVPQGYQAPPQGYQAMPHDQGYQAGVQSNEPHPQVQFKNSPNAQAQGSPQQGQGVPQAHPAVPQAQAMPQAQPVPQAHAIPQAQVAPQAQSVPLAQGLPQGQGALKKEGDNTANQQQQAPPGGVILQHQQDSLNQHPEIKPVEDNHIP